MKHVVPRGESLHGSTVIQQLGLDTEMGLQRILQILTDKIDPESKGFYITLADINHAVETMVTHRRSEWLILGEDDQIYFRLCTPEEIAEVRKTGKRP